MNLLKDRFQYAYMLERKGSQAELVTLHINDGNPRMGRFIRVSLQKHNKILKLMQNTIKPLFLPHNTKTSNKLVKKCVRIDEDLFHALCREVDCNESYISRTVSNTVLNQIKNRVIDVIETKKFKYRITIHFTKDQYKLIRQTINEIKAQGLKRITFSLLVRSILYKQFKLVTNIKKEVNSNVA